LEEMLSMPIGDYTLLVLDRLHAGCNSLSELEAAIRVYPEDTHREGRVIDGMLEFLARYSSLSAVKDAIREEMQRRGGRDYLEDFSEQMDFNEFLCGWDDADRGGEPGQP
jgi:hypothetical protein